MVSLRKRFQQSSMIGKGFGQNTQYHYILLYLINDGLCMGIAYRFEMMMSRLGWKCQQINRDSLSNKKGSSNLRSPDLLFHQRGQKFRDPSPTDRARAEQNRRR